MKTVDGITFDESKIYLSDEAKSRLSKFFNLPDAQNLINKNDFNELYELWFTLSSNVFDELKMLFETLLISEIPFLSHLSYIPYGSFVGAVSLIEINIPSNVSEINTLAFRNCINLISVKLGKNVASISDRAFHSCLNLKSINIPVSMKKIGEAVFYKCPRLQSIKYDGTKEQWQKIDKSDWWNIESGIKNIVCLDGKIEL